jgi:hypothetical protein
MRGSSYDIPEGVPNQQHSPAFSAFFRHWFVDSGALARGEVDLGFLDGLAPEEAELARDLLRRNLGRQQTHIIEGLAALHDVGSVPILREMMNGESDLGRQLTISGTLWKLVKDPIFVECLRRMKTSRNANLKMAHLRQVLWLNDERSIDLLMDFLDDADKFMQQQALTALNELEFERRFFAPAHQLPSQPDDYRARRTDGVFRARMVANLRAL